MPLPKLHGFVFTSFAASTEPAPGDIQVVGVMLPPSAAATRGGETEEKPLKRFKPKPVRSTHTGKGHARRISRPHIPRRR